MREVGETETQRKTKQKKEKRQRTRELRDGEVQNKMELEERSSDAT
jgi:hypothetical protein